MSLNYVKSSDQSQYQIGKDNDKQKKKPINDSKDDGEGGDEDGED